MYITNERLCELIENREKEYRSNPKRILSDYSREVASISSYNGRQIYELLQNAEDALSEGINRGLPISARAVSIKFKDDVLVISNVGAPFDLDGVDSLMYSNYSSKTNKNMIGRKGLGFRSILSWAKSVQIFSGDINIEFSNEYVKNWLKDTLESDSKIKELIERKKDKAIDWPIATLSIPKQIERMEGIDGYTTTILIKIIDSQDLKEQIVAQLESISELDVLFLNSTEILSIEYEDQEKVVFTKEVSPFEDEFIIVKKHGENCSKRTFKMFSYGGIIEEEDNNRKEKKPYEITLAYEKCALNEYSHYLYNYFRTNIKLPFGFIINCPFHLVENRNNLPLHNATNEELMEILSRAIVESAEKIASFDSDPYIALRATGFLHLDQLGEEFLTLKASLKNKINAAKVLPMISRGFSNNQGGVFFSKNRYEDCIDAHNLENFLYVPTLQEEDINSFLREKMKIGMPSPLELTKIIEDNIEQMSIEQKSKCIYFFYCDYLRKPNNIDRAHVPHLLVDNYGNSIKNGKVYALKEKYKDLSMPGFANFSILNSEQGKQLRDLFNCNEAEQLARYLEKFNLVEYEFSKIAKALTDQIDNNNLDYLIEMIKWIADVKRKYPDFITISYLASSLMLVNSEGNLVKASELYFGSDYGFNVTQEIIHKVAPRCILASPEFYDWGDDYEELIAIFAMLGVAKYPRKKHINVTSDSEQKEYLRYCFKQGQKISAGGYKYIYRDDVFSPVNSVKGEPYGFSIGVQSFEYFEEILKEVPYSVIINWMFEDQTLYSLLGAQSEPEGSYIGFQHNSWKKISEKEMKPYVKFVLLRTEWVETPVGKKKPRECCMGVKNFSPIIEHPIDVSKNIPIGNLSLKEKKDRLESIYLNVGIATEFGRLSQDVIYEILLALPQKDPESRKAREFYQEVLQARLGFIDIENSPSYQRFLKDGKVSAVRSGKNLYLPLKEVFYSDNRVFSDKLISQFDMLNLDKRKGEDAVEKYLGVSPLKTINVQVDTHTKSRFAEDFQKEYIGFLPYIIALHASASNINRIRNLSIILATDIHAKYESKDGFVEYEVDEYDNVLVKNENDDYEAFIKIKDTNYLTMDEVKRDQTIACALSEIVCGLLLVQRNRVRFQQLFPLTESERRRILYRESDEELIARFEEVCDQNIVSVSPKEDFWRIVLLAYKGDCDELTVEKICDVVGKEIYESVENIEWDYRNALEQKQLEVIVEVFKKIGIDKKDYLKYSPIYPISFDEWIKKEMLRLKQQCEKAFYSLVYQQFSQGLIDYNSAVSKLHSYNFIDVAYDTFNVEETFFDYIGVTEKELEEIHINDSEIINEFLNKRQDEILQPESEIEKPSTPYVTKKYDSSAVRIEDLKKTDIHREPIVQKAPTLRTQNGKKVDMQNLHEQDIETGRSAEKIVYDKLVALYGRDCVEWVSAYAKKVGINSEGADGDGYDIRYKDNSGKIHYVEVKGSKQQRTEFIMTENELSFAEKNAKQYEIYLVWNLGKEYTDDDIVIKRCPIDMFVYDENHTREKNKFFYVLPDNYRIILKES